MLYDRVIGEGFGGEWIHVVCMAESLHCSPETIMAFLIGYTPTQNKKSKSWKKFVWFRYIQKLKIAKRRIMDIYCLRTAESDSGRKQDLYNNW